jgi:CDP-6-deoxy-D-xylo-4-hexulose-3-dehydrase
MKKLDLRYGGSVCDKREERAIMKSVKQCIRTGNWQAGLQAKKMEAEASKTLGVKYGILTTSGSCAGLLALSALELPIGSEVIISAVTFPTIFNIILQCGLIPVVVDAKVGTYTFDVSEVEKAITKKTRAIIAIHPVGNPCDMVNLMKLTKKYENKEQKIYVIEDNCDGWGSSISGEKVGSFGDISITSFHAAHIISMGVGGGVFTNDGILAKRVRQYRDWGRQADTTKPHTCKTLPKDYNPRFVYDKIGYNFQILELQAAMGRVQLRKAKRIKEMRKKNFDYLVKGLNELCVGLLMPESVIGSDVCWFALPLTYIGNRGDLVAHLEKAGIETRSMFSGDITKHPAYKNSKFRISGKLEEADYILKHSFWITVHPRLTKSDLDYIIQTFKNYYA